MRNILVIITFIALFSFWIKVFSYEFDGYKWGQNKDEVKALLDKEGKDVFYADDSTIKYLDTIAGSECLVTLGFSPKSSQLAYVEIFWEDKEVGEGLKKVFTDKYGKPHIPQKNVNFYEWKGANPYDRLTLEYEFAGTKVVYWGGDYYSDFLLELEASAEKDKDRM